MNKEVIILIADDDDGHYALIKKNLRRSGISNKVLRFADGQKILDFLNSEIKGINEGTRYLLLLDIRMPKVDGVQVLEAMKENPVLQKIPVIILTTTDDPRAIDRCHALGCSTYIVKPLDYASFTQAINKVGLFLSIVEIPQIREMMNTTDDELG